MANKDGKFGLRPVRKLSGGNICTSNYDIATAYATAIYTGDVVELTGTGLNIQKAAATNEDNLGVFAGCRYVTAAGKPTWSPYWPGVSDGKTDIVAFVYVDPMIVYEVQFDTLAAANIGTVCDYNVGTGSASTGLSGLYAVAGSATTGGTLRVLRLVDRPDNAYGSYAKGEVTLAESIFLTATDSAGGVN